MLELEEAVAQILSALPKPVSERLALAEAHGRVLSGRVVAPVDLPVFDNSAMDGYAVRAGDVAAAAPKNPVALRLAGRVAAGETFPGELPRGACARVFTGSPLPRGADAVVMQEDTRLKPEHAGEVFVVEPVQLWENVRFRGEDVKGGAALAEAGDVLTAGRIALLSAVGLTHVSASRRPVVGLLATGSELREPGEALEPGQIYESNRAALSPLVRGAGGLPRIFPIVPDTADATRAALERALNECDLVVSCGGVSVGEMDFVKSAFEQLGGSLHFWKVAIRPGRPFVFGGCGGRFLFGLPGNPVSALVTFLLLVRPAILRWQGAAVVALPSQSGTLSEPLANPGARRHFMRVSMDGAGNARPAGVQASHVLSSFAAANGLVDVPPQTTFPAGATVLVVRWELPIGPAHGP